MQAIKIDRLTKEFDGITAVDQISFSVQTGELFGLFTPWFLAWESWSHFLSS
jgi:ABC-2 type transport system ATP-binding protein